MVILDEAGAPLRYASFWDRTFAGLVDALVIGMLSIVFFIFSFGFIGSVFVGWVYFALGESSAQQATIGKRMMGIIVTDMQGNRISFLQAAGRYLLRFISFAVFLFGIFLMFFTEKRQGLHDLLTGTLVIRR